MTNPEVSGHFRCGNRAAGSDFKIVASIRGKHDGGEVHDAYRALGFFVINKGGKIPAVSSFCIHRQVTLVAEADCSFYCKRRPASKDLPVLTPTVNNVGHLLVVLATS